MDAMQGGKIAMDVASKAGKKIKEMGEKLSQMMGRPPSHMQQEGVGSQAPTPKTQNQGQGM